MTARHAGPGRYRTTPAHYLTVALGIAATITVTTGITGGLRAGLATACLLIGIPSTGAGVLVLLCLAADTARTIRLRRVQRRLDLDLSPPGPADVEREALDALARRLHEGA